MRVLLNRPKIDSFVLIDFGRVRHEIENLDNCIRAGTTKNMQKDQNTFQVEVDDHLGSGGMWQRKVKKILDVW